jgi:WD40 repeat protein
MNAEEALEFVRRILPQQDLTRVQELVFRQAWENQSYEKIAHDSGYNPGYVKDAGSKLWQILSTALGKRVTKQNFRHLVQQVAQPPQPSKPPSRQVALAPGHPRCSWGEAIDVTHFCGRKTELERLQRWVSDEQCRAIAIIGMGGMGKTVLSVKLAEQVQPQFDHVIWRSLRQAPPLSALLEEILQILFHPNVVDLPETSTAQITLLLTALRQSRCLLVLDNWEAVFQSGKAIGTYRAGYGDYGELIQRLGEERHQSCLIITSREKPGEISVREGEQLPVRSLSLLGLSLADSQAFLATQALESSAVETIDLVRLYGGNPLALKIVSSMIQSLFGGSLNAFLGQETIAFGDIWDVLEEQFNRLSPLEQRVMYSLAIAREWLTFKQLQVDLIPLVTQQELLQSLNSLQGRSLIETSALGFTQQPVVMEYMTERLVKQVYTHLIRQDFSLLHTHALLNAQAKDGIREAQIRLIIQPICDRLLQSFGSCVAAADYLEEGWSWLQMTQEYREGYAAGNLINLAVPLLGDLSERDFSRLGIRHAYLPHILLHCTNFTQSQIQQSVFAETFGGVTCAVFSPNGTCLATGDTGGHILLWQVKTGQLVQRWKGHGHWVWAIAFSPNGKHLASVADDSRVKLWDIQTGECLADLTKHVHSINTLAFSPDGYQLATSGQDGTICLWDLSHFPYTLQRHWQAHEERVWSIAISPDGQMLASASEDRSIRCWERATGQILTTLYEHTHWVRAIAFSPEGQFLASGSYDQTIKLWDLRSQQCVQTFTGHTNAVTAVHFNETQQLASSSFDQTVRLWDSQTGTCLRTFQGHSNRLWTVAFHPDGNQLVSGGDDHATKLWDSETGQCLKTIKGHANAALSVAVHPQQEILASGHQDQTVRLWNTATGQCLSTLRGHTNRVWSVAFAPQAITFQPMHSSTPLRAEPILASGSADRTIKLWSTHNSQCLATLSGHTSWVWSVVFSPDAHLLASASYDHTVKLWQMSHGECIRTLYGHTHPVVTVAFSPDGQFLASGGFDQTIRIWHVATGEAIAIWHGHTSSIWSLAFSPDGEFLASSSFDQTIRIWDWTIGKCLRTLEGHTSAVSGLRYMTDDRLVSSSFDRTLRIWQTQTGESLQCLTGHTDIVCTLATHSQPMPKIWSASFDETLRAWDLTTGEVYTLRPLRPCEGTILTRVTGLTEAQRATLLALGAIEES